MGKVKSFFEIELDHALDENGNCQQGREGADLFSEGLEEKPKKFMRELILDDDAGFHRKTRRGSHESEF